MTKEEQDKLKLLYDKVVELEIEMSVSSKSNKYIEDIKKSSKLLIYRYALLVQIKDIRRKRGKAEDRISRIEQLKVQKNRGRILTQRELEAIENVDDDISSHEIIAEDYDNKKELYNDNRVVYLGMDENLEGIFFKYQELFTPWMKVNEKTVEGLKRFLDDTHNFNKGPMKKDEIIKANLDRYDDEIIDFPLGIYFDNPNDEKENGDVKFQSSIQTTKLDLLEKKVEEMTKTAEVQSGEKKEEKQNEEVISLQDEFENTASHLDVYSEDRLKDIGAEKEDFLKEEETRIARGIQKNRIDTSDDIIFKSNGSINEKTIKAIEEKFALKKRLEEAALGKVVDVSRNHYDEVVRLNQLTNDEDIDRIDMDLTNDIYELGIILMLKNKVDFETEMKKKRKNTDGTDDDVIKVLLDQIYQIGMQYKMFPGFCFNDTKEYDPEKVIAEINAFDGKNYVPLELSELYRATTLHTFTIDDIKKKYEEMYNINFAKQEQSEENEAIEM